MKPVFFAAVALLSAAPALAQPAQDMKAMPGMAAPAQDAASMTTADGAGVVTALDAKAGTVTIHHAPIAKLSWPAMTMAFKAASPSVLQGVKVGQAVKFQLMQMGDSTQLTAIRPN
jgi:Cu(I)/Ag(I) efflux system protein CusF